MSDSGLTACDMTERQNQYHFSIVIPVLNEGDRINALIEHLHNQGFESSYEIIVVDGDPQGGTVKAIQSEGVVTIASEKGRGRQMNAGAAMSSGDILIFLHADTMLPDGALKKISRALDKQDYVGLD